MVTLAQISAKPVATDGVAYVYAEDATGAVVKSHRQIFNVLDFGAVGDNTTDDAAAIRLAVAEAKLNGGGVVYFPATGSRYKVNSTIAIDGNNIVLKGEGKGVILDFAAQTSGPGIVFGGVFDWGLEDISVLNAYGANVEINRGTVLTGPYTFAAYGYIRNVAVRGARVAADNLEIAQCYMSAFDDVRSQDGVRMGIAVYGYCTSLTFNSCHAFDAASHGWQLKNITYSHLSGCGADACGGYGYWVEDAHLTIVGSGAETCDYSAFKIVYDSTTVSTIPGVNLTIDGFCSFNNRQVATAGVGYFVTLSGSPASSASAGSVTVRGLKELGTPTGSTFDGSGGFRVDLDQRSQSGCSWGASPGFAFVGDGVTDVAYPLPINITGSNTRIAVLQGKLRNSLSTYGGLITVAVSQNNRSSGSRSATYLLLVNRASAGTTGAINLVSAAGNTTGADATDASFTFSYDATSGELRASPVGSTATGNWYFHVSLLGNLTAVVA